MDEVVAIRAGNKITNSPKEIINIINSGADIELLVRQRMQLMAAFDLGINWNRLATGPTLFMVDDDGNLFDVGVEADA